MPGFLDFVKYLIVVIIALLSKPLGRWLTRDGKPHALVGIACWSVAIALLVAKSLTRDINDDEVYWLANAWDQAQGLTNGTPFLREMLFRPFLALGLSPSATVMAGRAFVVALAAICAWLASSISKRTGQSGLVTALTGPILVLWYTQMPMVLLRPEYFALAFLSLGLWVLLVPPAAWSRQTSIFLGFVLLALCATTSMRLLLFPLGALVCVVLYPGGIRRGAAAKWAVLGGLAGLAPTLLWHIATNSWKAVYYWNVVFPRRAHWLSGSDPLGVPPVLFALAILGCLYLLSRKEHPFSRTLVILWVTTTVLAVINPQKMSYTVGPWMMLSVLVVGASLSALPEVGSRLGQTRWAIIVFALLGVPLMASHAMDYVSPRQVLTQFQLRRSQLRLIDWIDQTRAGGPVICVSPYHPIRARNSWSMWNAWWFGDTEVRSLLLELDPNIESRLQSCEAAVIEWDPWQKRSDTDNVMQFWAQWGFVPSERTDKMAHTLADHYTPVHWNEALPVISGGGTFLLRKDLEPGPGVTALNKSVILDWRRKTH